MSVWGGGKRSLAVVAAVLLVLLGLGATLVPTVGADGATGTITGHVTDATTGQPLAGVSVFPYAASDWSWPGQDACTAADGSYTLSGVPAGSYRVVFSAQRGCDNQPGPFLHQDVTTPAVDVGAGVSTQVDASMNPAGAIQGTVTTGAAASPVGGVQVYVLTSTGNSVGLPACTNGVGEYTVGGLAAGQYIVEYTGESCGYLANTYSDTWYPGDSTQQTATRVTVSVGAITSGIDDSLAPNPASSGGLISGTLTNAQTGEPVGSGVEVEAQSTQQLKGEDVTACTGPQGAYTIGGLDPDSYQVRFVPHGNQCGAGMYLPQAYPGGAPTFGFGGPQLASDAETPVTVGAGVLTGGIDGSLTPAGTITGTVTDADTGAPADRAVVFVYDSAGNIVGSACSSSGSYTTTVLPSGVYRIGFNTDPQYGLLCLGGSNEYLPSYVGGDSLATARPITVTAPGTVSDADGSVVRGASITGTVTLGDHAPIVSNPSPGVFLAIERDVTVLDASGNVVGTGEVAADGSYVVGGLPSGWYTVRFSAKGYETQYSAGTPVQGAASPIHLTSGSTAANINATLTPTGDTGSISGTVTDAVTRRPLAGILVGVSAPGGPLQGSAVTGTDGTYTITGIPAGSDVVGFADPSGQHQLQYSLDSATLGRATPITIGAGSTQTGVDAAMSPEQASLSAALIAPKVVLVPATGVVRLALACPSTTICHGQITRSSLAGGQVRSAERTRGTGTSLGRRFSVLAGRLESVQFALTATERAHLTHVRHAPLTVTLRQGGHSRRYTLTLRRSFSKKTTSKGPTRSRSSVRTPRARATIAAASGRAR